MTHESGNTDADSAPSGQPPPISGAKTLAYSVANLGYGAFYALNNAILSLYLHRFTANNVIIGLGGSTHSFEGAIIQPLVGSASDRMRSRWGRRRPFMLATIPISSLFILLTPACGHIPANIRLAAMVICIFLFTLTFNISQDPYNALMPDITPEPQRGRVTGISMFVFYVGMSVLLLLPKRIGPLQVTTETKFIVCSILMLVTTLITCACIKEPDPQHEPRTSGSHLHSLMIAVQGLATLRQARKALLVSLLSGLGIGAVFPFLTIFVQTITRCSDNVAESMFLYLVATTALLVLPFGLLVDKAGPRTVLMAGMAVITAAASAGMWVRDLNQIRLVMIVAGIGNAAQFASAYPLLYELVPRQEVGFYTGLQSTAQSIATPLTAVLTGLLVNNGNYRRIFLVCSVFVLASIAALAAIQLRSAPEEIREREALLEGQMDSPMHPAT